MGAYDQLIVNSFEGKNSFYRNPIAKILNNYIFLVSIMPSATVTLVTKVQFE